MRVSDIFAFEKKTTEARALKSLIVSHQALHNDLWVKFNFNVFIQQREMLISLQGIGSASEPRFEALNAQQVEP